MLKWLSRSSPRDDHAGAPADPAPADPAGAIRVGGPVGGTVVPLASVSDQVFASGVLGQGVGIVPTDGHVLAPVTGVIRTLMPHAVGLETGRGAQILIHIGIDTVTLEGRGFTTHAAKGDRVTVGDLLVDVDLDVVRAAGLDPTVLVTLMNAKAFRDVSVRGAGPVEHGDVVITASPEEN